MNSTASNLRTSSLTACKERLEASDCTLLEGRCTADFPEGAASQADLADCKEAEAQRIDEVFRIHEIEPLPYDEIASKQSTERTIRGGRLKRLHAYQIFAKRSEFREHNMLQR